MQRTNTPFVVVAGFGASFVLGAWLAVQSPLATGSSSPSHAAGQFTASTIVPRAFPTDEEMLGAIMGAMGEDELLLRAHRLHQTVGQLTSAELAALLPKAIALKDDFRRSTLLTHLLQRWKEVDPVAAEAAIRPFLSRIRKPKGVHIAPEDQAVLEAWTVVSPAEVFAEAVANPDKPWSRTLAEKALSTLAADDPARQFDVLAQVPASPLRDRLCEAAIKGLAEKDLAAAEARLDLLPDRQRLWVHGEILETLAKRDPASALARLSTLAPQLPDTPAAMRLVAGLLQPCATADRETALATAAKLPEGLQKCAIGSILAGWAGVNPAEALTWSLAHGFKPDDAFGSLHFDGGRLHSAQSMLSVAFARDFDKTLEWMLAQPPSPDRDRWLENGVWGGKFAQKLRAFENLSPEGQARAVGTMVRYSYGGLFGSSDVQAVESWVQALPAGDVRTGGIRKLVSKQAENSPERMESLVAAWPAGPDREAAVHGIIDHLETGNPTRAIEFARQVTDPAKRELAFEQIAQSWGYHDRNAVRRWIAEEPEFSAAQKRILLRTYSD